MIVSKKFPFPLWVPVRSGPQKRENSHRKVKCNITAEKDNCPEDTDSTDSECYCEDEDPKCDSSDGSEHDEDQKPKPKASTFLSVKAFFEMLRDDECVDYPVNLEILTCQEAEASIILEAKQGLLNTKRRKQEIAVAKQAEAAKVAERRARRRMLRLSGVATDAVQEEADAEKAFAAACPLPIPPAQTFEFAKQYAEVLHRLSVAANSTASKASDETGTNDELLLNLSARCYAEDCVHAARYAFDTLALEEAKQLGGGCAVLSDKNSSIYSTVAHFLGFSPPVKSDVNGVKKEPGKYFPTHQDLFDISLLLSRNLYRIAQAERQSMSGSYSRRLADILDEAYYYTRLAITVAESFMRASKFMRVQLFLLQTRLLVFIGRNVEQGLSFGAEHKEFKSGTLDHARLFDLKAEAASIKGIKAVSALQQELEQETMPDEHFVAECSRASVELHELLAGSLYRQRRFQDAVLVTNSAISSSKNTISVLTEIRLWCWQAKSLVSCPKRAKPAAAYHSASKGLRLLGLSEESLSASSMDAFRGKIASPNVTLRGLILELSACQVAAAYYAKNNQACITRARSALTFINSSVEPFAEASCPSASLAGILAKETIVRINWYLNAAQLRKFESTMKSVERMPKQPALTSSTGTSTED